MKSDVTHCWMDNWKQIVNRGQKDSTKNKNIHAPQYLSVMQKGRNPNAAEIALPQNAFPVQSGFREKNDLVVVIFSISISIPAPKTNTITQLSIRHGEEPQSRCRGNRPPPECVSCGIRIREKGKDNDLAAVKINISISVPAPKPKINTHLHIRLWQRPIRICPWLGARSRACPI